MPSIFHQEPIMTQLQTELARTIKVAIVYHSGFGSTAKQAQAAAAGVEEVEGATALLISVDNVAQHWQDLDEADAIIFGTPTYMGGVSAGFKGFMEASSKIWADNLRWKNKIGAAFTNSQNIHGDKLNTLVSIAIFAAQHGMQWVGLDLYGGWNTTKGSAEDLNRLGSWLGAMAQSHGDSSEGPSQSDLKTTAHLGKRVASLAKQWVAGRQAIEEGVR
jgi:NAD(P)H dehydrogenase (quinone)